MVATNSKTSSKVAEVLAQIAINPAATTRVRKLAFLKLLRIVGQQLGYAGGFIRLQKQRIWRFISNLPVFFEVACRGGSKSKDFLVAAFIVCLGEPGTRGIWLSGDTGQLDEVTEFIDTLLATTIFAGTAQVGRTRNGHVIVRFSNHSFITFNAFTMTSGPRRNLIVYDEGGKISDSDKRKAYRNAHGMTNGTFRWPIRERHCSTLAEDTPAAEMYRILEPLHLVFKMSEDQCPWVHEKFIHDPVISRMPQWWVNIEYKCILDAPGGKIFPDGFKVVPAAKIERQSGLSCRIGLDWNPSWGHAVVIVIWNGLESYRVVAEWTGLDLKAMASFIKPWQVTWAGAKFIVSEGTKDSAMSRARDLRELGIEIDFEENWPSALQNERISYAQYLVFNGLLEVNADCKDVLDQGQSYHWDEHHAGKIPDQEDHCLDPIWHVIDSSALTKIDIPANFMRGVRA